MSTQGLIVIFMIHWMGDYLFQTSAMARLKSSHIGWLTFHVAVYTAVLAVGSFFLFPVKFAFQFIALNGIFHWITDFFTSKLAFRYADNPRIFYPIIGFDQFIHIATLTITANM